MKTSIIVVTLIITFLSCKNNKETNLLKPGPLSIAGSWQLLTGTLIEKGDTVVTDYNKKTSFIKIINDTHFAFLQHDLNKGKDSTAIFVAGGGKYTIKDSLYTEHLEYCNDRNWEGNDFTFTVTIKNDTLIQRGVEKVAATGVNRLNIEKYLRIK